MKRSNEKKDFKIKFSNEAFNVAFARSNLSNEMKPYTQRILEMNEAVEALDRYDDFADLKIKSKQYEYLPSANYGIVRSDGQTEAIYAHQRRAAKRFLSELRGFGLLADVVGSGKTFEAGVVLSELSLRGRINSVLIISPKQVYPAWINVLENCFGLGRGQLLELKETPNFGELREVGEFQSPERPCIVTMENFVNWEKSSVENILFDIIVVDEAHHLCDTEGQYSRAMELLSFMMEIKKQADKQFCILLSATPHSGNLENMFNLWYFIRANGGRSEDFVPGKEEYSIEYRKEKEYYKSHICHGASTVAEFIRIVKREIIEDANGPYRASFNRYLASIGEKGYDQKRANERDVYIDQFMDTMEEDDATRVEILTKVASQYHNEVLRPIMVRQERTPLKKKKTIVNMFFYPTRSERREIQLDTGDVFNVDKFAVVSGGKEYSYKEYLERLNGKKLFPEDYREKIASFVRFKLWNDLGVNDNNFNKQGSLMYYADQMRSLPISGSSNIESEFYPLRTDDSSYGKKLGKLKELLKKHANDRVLLFFDYDKRNAKEGIDRVKNDLLADPELGSRLCVGNKHNSGAIEEEFGEEKHNRTILLVEDAAFTEGINLQSSQIIINFEVTPDPLAMDQRIGRIFRLGQSSDVTIYSLADMTQLEGYVLMCFTSIGLMSSNSGDATILAGSSNERMVTIRCPRCGRVKLLSLEDYETFKTDKKSNEIYCRENEVCRDNDEHRTEMTEISTYDFKCTSSDCRRSFTRTLEEEGYSCMSVTNDTRRGVMCNSGEKGDRKYYCRKICAISHCERFKDKTDCPALQAYEKDRNVQDQKLAYLCANCKNKEICAEMGCKIDAGPNAIKRCHDCEYSGCSPKPHVINFNDKWEAKCPVCGKGTIKPVQARTFATFIRGAWDYQYDKGASFCSNLMKEVKKVKNIRSILESDGENR